MKVRPSIILFLLLILALPACQPARATPMAAAPRPTLPVAAATLLAAPSSDDLDAKPLDLAEAPSPTTGEQDPLHFTFPTTQPKGVSGWRAPLYDVPFSLSPYDHFFFIRPIAADHPNDPLPDYRYGGVFFRDVVHTGIDIPNVTGTPVLAAGPGRVAWAGPGLYQGKDSDRDPYGNAVLIRSDFGYKGNRLYTVYAHMDTISVSYGQRVETGDKLGGVGSTGFTTGPHLHFEVRLEYSSFYATRNPELWIVPPQGTGVLVGRMMYTNGSLMYGDALNVFSKETGRKYVAFAYAFGTVNRDDYYQENVVISGLPAGDYRLQIDLDEKPYLTEVTIHPGAVTYFTYRGKKGFSLDPPPLDIPEPYQEYVDILGLHGN